MKSIVFRRFTIILILTTVFLSSCDLIGYFSYQPPGIPLTISINSRGEISFDVSADVTYPTFLGTFSAGVIVDPVSHFQAKNILTVRIDGQEDQFYDLHGNDFNIIFESGYYTQIALRKEGNNLYLEVVRAIIGTPTPEYTPTPLATPSPTPPPNTEPSSVLDVGQTWWQDKLGITLTEAALSSSTGGYTFSEGQQPDTIGIEVKFQLTNLRNQDISIAYNLGESLSAFSNQGQYLEVGYLDRQWVYGSGGIPWSNKFETVTGILRSGETVELRNILDSYWGDPRIFIKANIADPSLTEIIVSVSGISNIANAQWHVIIYH